MYTVIAAANNDGFKVVRSDSKELREFCISLIGDPPERLFLTNTLFRPRKRQSRLVERARLFWNVK